jgi:hypothetical protein
MEGTTVANMRSLNQALKDLLADDGKVSKWDAKALKELIMSDGRVSTEEKLFLEQAIQDNNLDEEAYEMLSQLLLREEMKHRT